MTIGIAQNSAFSKSSQTKARTYVDNTYWGYVIRGHGLRNLVNLSAQIIAAGVGSLLVVSSILFWVATGTTMALNFGGLEYGMSVALFLFGMVLIWFASHGTNFEFHINTDSYELREMVRNAKGKTRLIRAIPFHEVGSAFIDTASKKDAKTRLVLRLRNSPKNIVIATDYEQDLRPILMRLVRDILPSASGVYAENISVAQSFDHDLNFAKPNRVLTKCKARGFQFAKAKGVVQPRRVSVAM